MRTNDSPLHLTAAEIEKYLQRKREAGMAPAALIKYKNALEHLRRWLGEDAHLTAERTQAWRKDLENSGYSKNTVQNYVKRVNDFLRLWGYPDLCIPKPLRNDLTGKTFGYLTVVEATEKRKRKNVVWVCACRCGKAVEIPTDVLLGGHTTSCGCLNIEILQHRNRYEEDTELRQALEEKIKNPKSVSGYVGVQPKRGKWAAYITYKKKHYYLGTYSDIEDAVKARARAKEAVMEDAARIYAETAHLYGDAPHRPVPPEKTPPVLSEPVAVPVRRTDNTSGYPGVAKQYGKWSVSISVKKYRYRLGTYDELEDAIAVRKRAEELVKTNDLDALKEMSTNRYL